jgi:hypothetical protein
MFVALADKIVLFPFALLFAVITTLLVELPTYNAELLTAALTVELPINNCEVVNCTLAPTLAEVVAYKVAVLTWFTTLRAAALTNVALAVKAAPTVSNAELTLVVTLANPVWTNAVALAMKLEPTV